MPPRGPNAAACPGHAGETPTLTTTTLSSFGGSRFLTTVPQNKKKKKQAKQACKQAQTYLGRCPNFHFFFFFFFFSFLLFLFFSFLVSFPLFFFPSFYAGARVLMFVDGFLLVWDVGTGATTRIALPATTQGMQLNGNGARHLILLRPEGHAEDDADGDKPSPSVHVLELAADQRSMIIAMPLDPPVSTLDFVFSRDGRLAVMSEDRTTNLWDLRTGTVAASLPVSSSTVALSPDNKVRGKGKKKKKETRRKKERKNRKEKEKRKQERKKKEK